MRKLVADNEGLFAVQYWVFKIYSIHSAYLLLIQTIMACGLRFKGLFVSRDKILQIKNIIKGEEIIIVWHQTEILVDSFPKMKGI